SFGNMESKPIAWTPSSLTLADNIQEALTDASMFGAGNVIVTPASTGGAATDNYYISFRGLLANAHFSQMTGTGKTGLPNGAINAANFVTGTTAFSGTGNEVQTLNFASLTSPTATAGGYVQLSFNGVSANGSLLFLPAVTGQPFPAAPSAA